MQYLIRPKGTTKHQLNRKGMENDRQKETKNRCPGAHVVANVREIVRTCDSWRAANRSNKYEYDGYMEEKEEPGGHTIDTTSWRQSRHLTMLLPFMDAAGSASIRFWWSLETTYLDDLMASGRGVTDREDTSRLSADGPGEKRSKPNIRGLASGCLFFSVREADRRSSRSISFACNGHQIWWQLFDAPSCTVGARPARTSRNQFLLDCCAWVCWSFVSSGCVCGVRGRVEKIQWKSFKSVQTLRGDEKNSWPRPENTDISSVTYKCYLSFTWAPWNF